MHSVVIYTVVIVAFCGLLQFSILIPLFVIRDLNIAYVELYDVHV